MWGGGLGVMGDALFGVRRPAAAFVCARWGGAMQRGGNVFIFGVVHARSSLNRKRRLRPPHSKGAGRV